MFKGFTGILIAAVLLSGCASTSTYQAYPGAPLPPDETCVLVVPALLDVVAIDGAPMERLLRMKLGSEQQLLLLPGAHTLQVRYYDPTADESRHELYMAGPVIVRFQAEPRGVYRLRFETSLENPALRRTHDKFRAWIGDSAPEIQTVTGRTQAGIPTPPPALPTAPAKSVLLDHATP